MKFTRLLTLAASVVALIVAGSVGASAQSTLEIVKKRGLLRCQVGPPAPGFYNLDANGEWYGSDVSICQAVAAAIFGDKTKLEIQSVSSQVRFTALANGESDLLSRTATWTLLRDTQLGLDFTAINFWFLSRMYARSVRQIGLLASSNRKWPGVFDAPQG